MLKLQFILAIIRSAWYKSIAAVSLCSCFHCLLWL